MGTHQRKAQCISIQNRTGSYHQMKQGITSDPGHSQGRIFPRGRMTGPRRAENGQVNKCQRQGMGKRP